MSENLPRPFSHQALSVSHQIVLSVLSTTVRRAASALYSDQSNSSLTSSLRTMITKKFKRLFSNGSSTRTKTLNSRNTYKKSPKSASTTTSQTSLPLPIDCAHAFKKVRRCPRISQHYSAMASLSSTLTLFLSLLTYLRP